MIDLEGIRARCSQATAGPWARFSDKGQDVALMPAGRPGDVARYEPGSVRKEDAVFIALARSDIPALVAEVERLRRLLVLHGVSPDAEHEE